MQTNKQDCKHCIFCTHCTITQKLDNKWGKICVQYTNKQGETIGTK